MNSENLIGQSLIINFQENKASITDTTHLLLEDIMDFRLFSSFEAPANWEVEIRHYDPLEKIIRVRILEDKPGIKEFNQFQKTFSDELSQIKDIQFINLPTATLIRSAKNKWAINHSTKKKSKTFPKKTAHRLYKNRPLENSNHEIILNDIKDTLPQKKTKPIVKTIKRNIVLDIDKLTLKDNKVTFTHSISEIQSTLEFVIRNEHIKKEYEPIKTYFLHALSISEIRIEISISTENDAVTQKTAISKDISSITENTIKKVSLERTKSFFKKQNNDLSLKGISSLKKHLSDQNLIAISDEEIINQLSDSIQSKHHKHLEYLVNNHNSSIMELMYLTNPISFLFLIKSSNYYCFVWETLETKEATYIWKNKKCSDFLNSVEIQKCIETIKTILKDGKRSYRENPPENFNLIHHTYTDDNSGFIEWKKKLESNLLEHS